jgi:hypothetical protein
LVKIQWEGEWSFVKFLGGMMVHGVAKNVLYLLYSIYINKFSGKYPVMVLLCNRLRTEGKYLIMFLVLSLRLTAEYKW